MAKRSGRHLSKKFLPKGALRKRNNEGFMMWFWGGEQYWSMRDLIFRKVSGKDKEEKLESVVATTTID